MRAIHVVSSIAAEASGPSYTVPRLCEALAHDGVEVTLHVLAPKGASSPPSFEVREHRCWPVLPRLGVSPHMRRALRSEATRAQVLHDHGLWMMPNVYAGFAVGRTGCRLVTSPRGVLDPWARRRTRWKKKLFWIIQRRTLERTDCFHATSTRELESIRESGFRAPTAIIPNGVDVPSHVVREARTARRLLFLGRIHPVKGLDLLLPAWARIARQHENWELHIVGPGEVEHVREATALAERLRAPRVLFRGPAYGAAKWREYAAASAFVLPSRTENFGMSVAEALASGSPVIVTKGVPWSGVDEERCGWWIDGDVDAISACLDHALGLEEPVLAEMGARGRAWVEREFSWQRVGQRMADVYSWLVDGGSAPSCIRMG